MIAEAAKRLMDGAEGADVVEFLRQELLASAQRGGREYSVNTLKTYVSKAKALVLENNYRNSCDFSELQRFPHPDIWDLLAADLKTQIQIQRRHRSTSFESTWTDEMESALQALALLPPNRVIKALEDKSQIKRSQEMPFHFRKHRKALP